MIAKINHRKKNLDFDMSKMVEALNEIISKCVEDELQKKYDMMFLNDMCTRTYVTEEDVKRFIFLYKQSQHKFQVIQKTKLKENKWKLIRIKCNNGLKGLMNLLSHINLVMDVIKKFTERPNIKIKRGYMPTLFYVAFNQNNN